MRSIDHQPIRLAALGRQLGEDAIEHSQAAPADEPVVDRLVGPQAAGACRQRRPFLSTKMIPEINLRSSARRTR